MAVVERISEGRALESRRRSRQKRHSLDMHSAAEVPVPSTPCIRSHELSFFERPNGKGLAVPSPAKDCLVKPEEGTPEIFKLVKNMPVLVRNAASNYLRLLVPPDVDLATVPSDRSWFSDVVLTFMDRNGSVIFHEAHFSPNSSLSEGISNFVDTRWGDYVHNEDLDVWNQHLNEAFSEADRWRANHLSASDALAKTEFDTDGQTGDRRRVCSGANQQVSTTSKLSPEGGDTMRHFVLSSVYRAKWGTQFYYFRSLSLPFLRNQPDLSPESCSINDASESDSLLLDTGLNASTKAASQPDLPTPSSTLRRSQESCDIGVFSPTSSFENLLLLNYHCIIGKCTSESESWRPMSITAPPCNSTLSPSMAEKSMKQLKAAPDDLLLSSSEFSTAYPQYEEEEMQLSAAPRTNSLKGHTPNFASQTASLFRPLNSSDDPAMSVGFSDRPAQQQQHHQQQPRECELCVPDTSVPTSSRPDAADVPSYAATGAEAKHVIHYRAGNHPFPGGSSASQILFCAPNADPSMEPRGMGAYSVSENQRYPGADADPTPFGTAHSSSPGVVTSPSRSTYMNYIQPQRVAGSAENSVYFPEDKLEERHGHHRQHHTQQHQTSASSLDSVSNRTSRRQTSANSPKLPPTEGNWLEQVNSPNHSHASPSSKSASAPPCENAASKPAMQSLLKTVPDPWPQPSFRPRAATDLSQCSIKGALARLGNQTDRVSLVVSLLPPEVIEQIRRACENTGCASSENRASSDSATLTSSEKHPTDTETIAHRVHAILVRYLGPGSLARFFQSTTSEASPLLPRASHSASPCAYRSPTESTPVTAKSTMSCSTSSSCSSTPSLVSTTRIFKNTPQPRLQHRQSLVSELTLTPRCTEVCETSALTSAGRPSTKESTPFCPSNTSQPLPYSVPLSQRSSPGTSTNLDQVSSISYAHANLQQTSAALNKRQSVSSYELGSISSAASTSSNSGVLESLLSGYVDCRLTSPTFRGGSSTTIRQRNASEACTTKRDYGACVGWPSPPASGRSSTASLLTPKTPNLQPYNSSSSIKSLVFDFSSEPHSPFAESSAPMTAASASYHSGDGTVHNLSGSPLDQELTTPNSSPCVCGPGRSSLLVRLLHNDLTDPPPPTTQPSANKNDLTPTCRSSLAHLLLHGVPPVASLASSKVVTCSADLPLKGASTNSVVKSEPHTSFKSSSPVNCFGQQPASPSVRDQLQRTPYAEHTQSPVCAQYAAPPPLPEYGASTALGNHPLTRPLSVNPTTTLSSPSPRVEGLEATAKTENNGGALSSSLYRLLLDSNPCPETIQAEVESATAQGFVTAPPTPAYPVFPPTSSAGQAPPTEDSFRLRGDDDLWDLLDDPLMSSFLMDGDASRPKSLDPPAKMFPEALTLAASSRSNESVHLPPVPLPDSYSAEMPMTKRARYSSESATCDFTAQPRGSDPLTQQLSPKQQTLLSPCLQPEPVQTSSLSSPESRQRPDVVKHIHQNWPQPRSGNGFANPNTYTPPSAAATERNRAAAAAAAAKIAQEAANQQRNSSTQWRLAEEKKRLLRLQKNCLLMNSGRAGNHSLPTQSPLPSSGSGGFDQLSCPIPGAAASPCPLPLEDFTKKLKEIAPNVNVQKTPAISCPSFLLEDSQTLPQSKFHDNAYHLNSASCEYSDSYRGCGGDPMGNRPLSASQYDFPPEPLEYSPRRSPVSGAQPQSLTQTLPQPDLLKPPPADVRHLSGGIDNSLLPRHQHSCHSAITRTYAPPPAYPSTALPFDEPRAMQDNSLLRRASRMNQASTSSQMDQYEMKIDPHVSAVSVAAASTTAAATIVNAPNNRHNMVKAELRMVVTNRCQISAETSSQFRNDPSGVTNKMRNIKTAVGVGGIDSKTNGGGGGGLVVHSPKQHGPSTTGLQRGGVCRSNDQHPHYRPRTTGAHPMISPDIQSVPPAPLPSHPSGQHYPQGCASGIGSDAIASPVVSPYAFDASPSVTDSQVPYHAGNAPHVPHYGTSPPQHLQQQQQQSHQMVVMRDINQSAHALPSDLMPHPHNEESCLREACSPQMPTPTFHHSALPSVPGQNMKNGPLPSAAPQLSSSQPIQLGGCGGQSTCPLPPADSGYSDHNSLLLGSAFSSDVDDVVLPEDIVNDVFELEKLSRLA